MTGAPTQCYLFVMAITEFGEVTVKGMSRVVMMKGLEGNFGVCKDDKGSIRRVRNEFESRYYAKEFGCED